MKRLAWRRRLEELTGSHHGSTGLDLSVIDLNELDPKTLDFDKPHSVTFATWCQDQGINVPPGQEELMQQFEIYILERVDRRLEAMVLLIDSLVAKLRAET